MSYRARAIMSTEIISVTLNNATSGTATLITTVDKNYSIIELLGVASASGSGNADVNAMSVELTNGTTVTARVNSAEVGNHIAWAKVTQYFPWTMLQPVQHKNNTDTFTAVGAKGEVFNGGFLTGDTSGVASQVIGGVRKTSSTGVTRFGGAAGHVAYYCVADWK